MTFGLGRLGASFGKLGAQPITDATPVAPTGDGTMDFSDEDNSALIALLEDI